MVRRDIVCYGTSFSGFHEQERNTAAYRHGCSCRLCGTSLASVLFVPCGLPSRSSPILTFNPCAVSRQPVAELFVYSLRLFSALLSHRQRTFAFCIAQPLSPPAYMRTLYAVAIVWTCLMARTYPVGVLVHVTSPGRSIWTTIRLKQPPQEQQ